MKKFNIKIILFTLIVSGVMILSSCSMDEPEILGGDSTVPVFITANFSDGVDGADGADGADGESGNYTEQQIRNFVSDSQNRTMSNWSTNGTIYWNGNDIIEAGTGYVQINSDGTYSGLRILGTKNRVDQQGAGIILVHEPNDGYNVDNSNVGNIGYHGVNDASVTMAIIDIYGTFLDVTDGTEDASLWIAGYGGGSYNYPAFKMDMTGWFYADLGSSTFDHHTDVEVLREGLSNQNPSVFADIGVAEQKLEYNSVWDSEKQTWIHTPVLSANGSQVKKDEYYMNITEFTKLNSGAIIQIYDELIAEIASLQAQIDELKK